MTARPLEIINSYANIYNYCAVHHSMEHMYALCNMHVPSSAK